MYMHATFYLPQVLAVNILGRFLLNNDRNIRLVLFGFSLTSSPPPPHIPVSLSIFSSILPLLSLRVICTISIPQGQQQTHCSQREPSQRAVVSLSSLITFPGAVPPEPNQKVTVCLLMLISSFWALSIFIRQCGGQKQVLLGFVMSLLFWVYLHRGCVTRQACQVFTGGPLNVSLAV